MGGFSRTGRTGIGSWSSCYLLTALAKEIRALCTAECCEPSVGSADAYDYALAETINGSYKAEVIHRRASIDKCHNAIYRETVA